MSKPTVTDAIEAAKALRAWADSEANCFPATAILTLLDYTQADRWRFGYYTTDFGEIVAYAGPPDAAYVKLFDTPEQTVAAADEFYGGADVGERLTKQFRLMGVMK